MRRRLLLVLAALVVTGALAVPMALSQEAGVQLEVQAACASDTAVRVSYVVTNTDPARAAEVRVEYYVAGGPSGLITTHQLAPGTSGQGNVVLPNAPGTVVEIRALTSYSDGQQEQDSQTVTLPDCTGSTTTTVAPTSTTTPSSTTATTTVPTTTPPLYKFAVTSTGCTANELPYVGFTFTNQTGGDVLVDFSYSLDGGAYTDPLSRGAPGHGGTYTDRFEFSPGTTGTVTLRAEAKGDAPQTLTATAVIPACEPPPPPPGCDCEGRQVRVANANKYLLPAKEMLALGITCFNIRLSQGEYLVSASGPDAALKKLFDRD